MPKKRLRTRHDSKGMYSMTTRKGESSIKALLKKFGDVIFDAGDRGTGSGRPPVSRRPR